MTAGRGIAHAEDSPPDHSPVLHGVQLWVALPARHRDVPPGFEHLPRLPMLVYDGVTVTVLMGEMDGVSSPAKVYSPIVGAEIVLEVGADGRLPLDPDFEYGVLSLAGTGQVDGVSLVPGSLLYLGSGRSDVALRGGHAQRPSRMLLLGGEPFEEHIVMWWNFVGRDHNEIARSRDDWMTGRRFGTVRNYDGDPLPAPPMPSTPLKPRGRQR